MSEHESDVFVYKKASIHKEYSNLSVNNKRASISRYLAAIPESQKDLDAISIYNIIQEKTSQMNIFKSRDSLIPKPDKKFKHHFTLEILSSCESKPTVNLIFNKTEQI